MAKELVQMPDGSLNLRDKPERAAMTDLTAEEKRLRGILAWCRPRLMNEYYRGALDHYIADQQLGKHEGDGAKLIHARLEDVPVDDLRKVIVGQRTIIAKVVPRLTR